MRFETPRLDDRSFADLTEEARRRIALYCPEWTDHNLSDPGITLIELFAWMTDIVLYRLNRVPDKHYVKMMELIGIRLREAEPARVPITFWLSAPQPTTLTIPGGTEIATVRTDTDPAIVFMTDASVDILVPELTNFMTSARGQEGRQFENYDVESLQETGEHIPLFASNPPQPNDAFYFGFDQNLSHHIVGFELTLDTAEGAGVDPDHPPYVWEVLSFEDTNNWEPIAVDYDSTRALNVSGLIRVLLPELRRAIRNDISAYWIRCRLNPPDDLNTYRVSPELRLLAVESWGITVNATNAQRVEYEVLGRSDGTPGQTFFLSTVPVTRREPGEYLIVRTEDGREMRWTEVYDFSTSTPKDTHYTIDSQTGEVRLGPALPERDGHIHCFGAIPEQNAMLLMRSYRSGGGVIGNVAKNTINVLKSSIPYIERVTNREAASGGLNAETLETAKMRVPGYLRSLARAVTPQDFEYLAVEAAPGEIGRIHCLQPSMTTRGEVNLLVIPSIPRLQGFIAPESLNLSDDLRDRIVSYLNERRLVSTLLNVVQPAYQWVETEIRLRHNPLYDGAAVVHEVENRLFTFLNPIIGGTDGKGWPFGRDLFVADIMAVLLAVPGVDYIRTVKLYPVSYNRGQFTRTGDAVTEISVVQHGVIVSYKHDVRID
ncbi:MAG TPA: putative baseplate assembly protein [Phototrophicaceae bacterium]|nr:putative baseplate assembly protein [Phototrophicaceae bacterium]